MQRWKPAVFLIYISYKGFKFKIITNSTYEVELVIILLSYLIIGNSRYLEKVYKNVKDKALFDEKLLKKLVHWELVMLIFYKNVF